MKISTILMCLLLAGQLIPKVVSAGEIRIVYLSPSDRPYRADYENSLTQAVSSLQAWYIQELDGYAMILPDDPVAWYQLPETAAWYQTNPAFRPPEARFWESVLAAAFDVTGGMFNDPDNRWIYYVDIDPLSGQYSGGTSGVALLPANDLRGLNGDPLFPIDSGWSTVNPGFDRWVGGLGNELGHALNLPHPPGSPGGPDDWSLMYYGYLTFPDTYLRQEDKDELTASGFFEPVPVPPVWPLVLAGLVSFAAWRRLSGGDAG